MDNVIVNIVDDLDTKETSLHLPSEISDNEIWNSKKYCYTFNTQPLMETDLKKLLRQVTGVKDIKTVTEVKLKIVSGQAGLHRLSNYTPNLNSLILDGSCISSFRDLGSSLNSLKTLSVARCNMRHLDGIWGFKNLIELNAKENFISDPSPCSGIKKLSKLDIGNNEVNDVSYLAFLISCKKLRELRIAGNKFFQYRKDIRQFLPQLRILDDEELEGFIPGVDALESEEDEEDEEDEEEEEEEEEKESNDIQVSVIISSQEEHQTHKKKDSETGLKNDEINTQETKQQQQQQPTNDGRLSHGRIICGNLAVSLLKRNQTKNYF